MATVHASQSNEFDATQKPTIAPGVPMTMADVRMQQCPECMSEGTFRIRPQEMAVSVGNDTALVTVDAIVCDVCGYEMVDGVNATRLDMVRQRLEQGDTSDMEAVG